MGKITGIDLGTTFSAISHLNDMGRPDIIANGDGERVMHSASYFTSDGRVLTGAEAIRSRYDDVSRSVRWIKRHMGDADHLRNIDGKDYTPAELSALILKKLHQDAIPQIGEISDVVISIPANFGEVARKATQDAGKIAGLNVVGIVNEPTAAAFYYAITHEIAGHVMIFDLGGGTFDVSIANVAGKDIDIIASSGDSCLGGYNFDQKLTEFFANKYKEETGGVLYSTDEEKAEIEDYAEDTKKSLSKKDSVSYRLKGDSGRAQGTITRSEFESLISSDLARIEMLIETVLDEANNQSSDIEKVLLVGGSSRIPAVQSLLKRMFGYEPSLIGNVDECVSLGAALYAGLRLLEEEPSKVGEGIASGLGDITVSDVCNHSYGTVCISYDEILQKDDLKNVIIIPKNTPVPCSEGEVLMTRYDGQDEVRFRVTQGESDDPDAVEVLMDDHMKLPPGRPTGCPIDVEYSYDENQRMTCTFTDRESRISKVFTYDLKSGESSAETIADQKAKIEDFTIE